LNPTKSVQPTRHPPGAVKPHHVVAPEGAVVGWSHLGMLAAARWVLAQTKYRLIGALAQHPDYQLLVVGGSTLAFGGGVGLVVGGGCDVVLCVMPVP
jgi:hypothetical protein